MCEPDFNYIGKYAIFNNDGASSVDGNASRIRQASASGKVADYLAKNIPHVHILFATPVRSRVGRFPIVLNKIQLI